MENLLGGQGFQLDQKAGRIITLSQGDRKPLEAVSQGMTLSDVSSTKSPRWPMQHGQRGQGDQAGH